MRGTPTITTKIAGATDNFGSLTTDLSTTNLQATTSGTDIRLSYTFPVGSAYTGYEIDIDMGALSSGSKTFILAGWDFRATPGVATGLNSNPPPVEQPPVAVELARNQRYFETSYGNGVALGTATANGMVCGNQIIGVNYKVEKRVAATFSYWDAAGNASKYTDYNSGSATNNQTPSNSTPVANGVTGVLLLADLSGADLDCIHFSASAEL
jgi:hypothetical protein